MTKMKHEQILKMIEGVDPSDTETMDEIDARVCLFLHYPDKEYRGQCAGVDGQTVFISDDGNEFYMNHDFPTRSRDALKAIRPDGWGICHSPQGKYNTHIIVYCYQIGQKGYNTKGGLVLPTEELAELHAIVQAIAYERKVNNEE